MSETRHIGNPNWHKGMKSPNPGGRPKGKSAMIQSMIDLREIVQFVRDILFDTKKLYTLEDKKWAAKFAMEHGWGKPEQTVMIHESDCATEFDPSKLDENQLDELDRLMSAASVH